MSERPTSAVVLGGSHAGMLAARALATVADHVTVVERDALPAGPVPRKGLPQARHVHQLWSGGAHALEELLPGVTDRLREAGAHRLPVTTDMVVLSPKGWYRRWAESHFMLLSGRDLLDATVRAQVLEDDRVELVDRAEVLGLDGTGAAVTGVRLRAHGHTETTLRADLVVDATGRGSRAVRWLTALGLPAPRRRDVDSGLAYASRLYRAPEAARDGFPVVNVMADPRSGGPGRGGVLMPVENGQWLVTLLGTRGGEPSPDTGDFDRYARHELRHPIVADLIDRAEPLTDVAFTRTTANRRHFYEGMRVWPDNFAVLGDALAAFNPVYGHGMSVAALSAVALRDVVRRHGWGSPGLSRRVQKAVARPVGPAWDLAIGQDVFYPGATEHGPTRRDRLAAAYVDRLTHTATGNGRVARTVTDVMSLEREARVLLAPGVLLAAAAGPLKPALTAPPLTAQELKAAGLP
ncbi:FAD-dependent oxidoreductase [Streptomyces sp. ALI-76-A]|jgi:2-polyprenyl-6-methoxyphenol hydroxylase-like FAD-dependent oxidoreductase|uniref:FAD-dependent oxidoreductase n=1 Tax=Streptomyces sp. ALI-76-A TaxID=3025736 RepID=UPI00256F644D|nr:FAD-dependent oxidoreductase [Streptomyces sp. ALI-76-A]MDL5201406.1 FAD-dependent oxidoreductase [Streptomyces sp. ALI-76-A]